MPALTLGIVHTDQAMHSSMCYNNITYTYVATPGILIMSINYKEVPKTADVSLYPNHLGIYNLSIQEKFDRH